MKIYTILLCTFFIQINAMDQHEIKHQPLTIGDLTLIQKDKKFETPTIPMFKENGGFNITKDKKYTCHGQCPIDGCNQPFSIKKSVITLRVNMFKHMKEIHNLKYNNYRKEIRPYLRMIVRYKN